MANNMIQFQKGLSLPEFFSKYGTDHQFGNIKNAIRGTDHAISQKHISRYLAEFSYRFNRRFQLGKMIERLAYVAVRTAPMPQHQLKLAETRW